MGLTLVPFDAPDITGEVGPLTDLDRLAGIQFGLLVLRDRDRRGAAEAHTIAE